MGFVVRSAGRPEASPSKPPAVCADKPPALVRAKFLREQPYPMSIDPDATYDIRIVTSCGTLYGTLLPKQAPIAVNNFVSLAMDHWYQATYFHRIDKGLDVIEGGDPRADGTGGPGYTIDDDPGGQVLYQVGSLVMAGDGSPDSAGSRFFIITGPDGLDLIPPGQTVFGQLVGDTSLQVARKIGSVAVEGDTPLEKVWILSIRIDEKK